MSAIFKYPPLAGPFKYTQLFGARPNYYDQYNLLGHEGVDMVAENRPTLGDPVHCVSDGVVTLAGYQKLYGNVVKVRDISGTFETVYAHLDKFKVAVHDIVLAGTMLGTVGASGNATAPHLHFGFRVYPFDSNDGWAGFSDPKPHIDMLYEWPGANIGVHIQDQASPYLDDLVRLQPASALFLHPNAGDIVRFKQACPNTTIICRLYRPDSEYSNAIKYEPVQAAEHYHNEILKEPAVELADYWQTNNEVCQSRHWFSPTDHRTELGQHNIYAYHWMSLADEYKIYKCIIGMWSVGNIDVDPDHERGGNTMYAWEKMYPSMDYAQANGHAFGVHQYWWDEPAEPEEKGGMEWLSARLEWQVLHRLPHRMLPFYVTEYGADKLLVGNSPQGYMGEITPYDYTNHLVTLSNFNRRWAHQIKAYNTFCLGIKGHEWYTYDIAGDVLRMLAEHFEIERQNWPIEPEPPTEPPLIIPPIPPEETVFKRRISLGAKDLGITILPLDGERPDDAEVWAVKDIWTTHNGSWEVNSGDVWSVPLWARADYLMPASHPCYNDDGGGDINIFGSALQESYDSGAVECHLEKDVAIMYWSDDRDYPVGNDVKKPVKTKSGWANIHMSPGANFNPEIQQGPWKWMLEASSAEIVKGAGLPWNNHVSFFAVWQSMTWLDYKINVIGETPPDPDPDPDPVPPDEVLQAMLAELSSISNTLKKLAEHFGVEI